MIDVWVAVLGQLLLASALVARALWKNKQDLAREQEAEGASRQE